MIIQARINGESGQIYKLCEWSSAGFVENPVLKLQTDNLVEVKTVFSEISKIEIFQSNVLIGEYNLYDTFSFISYLGKVYVQHENVFADCLEVRLQKSSLEEQVKRIEEAISDNVDIEAMTVEEYREYVTKQVNADCKLDIYAGTIVEIDGTPQNFSFKSEDQINLLQLYVMSKMYPTITVLPYHSDGQTCKFYTAKQIATIYTTMVVRLISITTYTNQLHMYINTLSTKEDLEGIEYGMALPEEYARVVADIVSETIAALHDLDGDEDESESDSSN